MAIMARLIKIYDADWPQRKKRPAHLEPTLWWLRPGAAVGAASPGLSPVWMAAAPRERVSRVETSACRLSVTSLRAGEE
jgi:hypothetical protein